MKNLMIILPTAFLSSVFGQGVVCGQNYCPDKYRGKEQTITLIRVANAAVIPEKWNKEVDWTRTEKMVRAVATDE